MKHGVRHWALISFIAVGTSASAEAQQAPAKAGCRISGFPAPELCVRAGLDTVRARYVLLVDESGSMKPLWQVLKRALADFALAIPEGDELDVRVFSSTARALVPTAPASPATRASWRRTFETLPAPAGSATDLGLAAAAALQAVRNADPEQVQLVFFLTDGQHQPPVASPYATALQSGPWQELAASARAVTTSRPISVSVVRLDANADTEVLRTIFSSAVPVDALDEQALQRWFANSARDAAVAKLTVLVRRELSRPVATLEAPEGITTHSDRLEHHDVRVTGRRRIVTTVLRDSTPASLVRGGQIAPSSDLWTGADAELRMAGAPHWPWVPPGSIRRTIDERVPIPTRLEPAEELGRIGITADSVVDSLQLRFAVREGGALSGWLYYSIVVLLGLTVLWAANRARKGAHRPYLDGRVIVRSTAGPPASASHALRDRRITTTTIAGTDGRELIQLEAHNDDGRTVIQAVPLTDDLTVRGKPFRAPIALTSKTVFATPTDEVTYLTS